MLAQPSQTIEITDTSVAASLSSLGFPWDIEKVISDRTRKLHHQFLFQLESPLHPQLSLADITRRWSNKAPGAKLNQLEIEEPMHRFCIAMLAQRNYDRLLERQKTGAPVRLGARANGQVTCYLYGVELASITQSAETESTDDLCLAAALGLVGLPVINITGSSGARLYHLPQTGYPLRLADDAMHLYRAADMLRRSPTKEDRYRLALEVEQPDHALCVGYNALHHRRTIKAMLKPVEPLVILEKGGHSITNDQGAVSLHGRQALIHMNAKGRVMKEVERHFKAPPQTW